MTESKPRVPVRVFEARKRVGSRGMVFAVLAGAVLVLIGSVAWMTAMPGKSFEGSLPEASESDVALSAVLRGHVESLVADGSPRSLWANGLDRSVAYLSQQIREMGLEPRLHTFEIKGDHVSNVEVEIPGGSSKDEIVVVGAHYDTVDTTPGADDNASGVAGVLELIRTNAEAHPQRTLRFVFFVNEEPPHFQTKFMGSLAYAERSRSNNDNVVAMLSIESIGFFSDEEGSQHYPPGFSLLYPTRADFVGVVGNLASRTLVRRTISTFRKAELMPSEGIAAPMLIPGIGWSDHWAFAVNDYPAAMITDTAVFRNPHYHGPTDKPDTLDYPRMTLVVRGIQAIVEDLAQL